MKVDNHIPGTQRAAVLYAAKPSDVRSVDIETLQATGSPTGNLSKPVVRQIDAETL